MRKTVSVTSYFGFFFSVNNANFHFCSVNLENNQIKFRIHFPKLVTRGLYSLDGRILMLPIVGNGMKEGNYSEFSSFENKLVLKCSA